LTFNYIFIIIIDRKNITSKKGEIMAIKAKLRRKVEHRIERTLRKREKQANRQKKAESKRVAQNKKQLSCTTAGSTP
jgi:hypothetical protein